MSLLPQGGNIPLAVEFLPPLAGAPAARWPRARDVLFARAGARTTVLVESARRDIARSRARRRRSPIAALASRARAVFIAVFGWLLGSRLAPLRDGGRRRRRASRAPLAAWCAAARRRRRRDAAATARRRQRRRRRRAVAARPRPAATVQRANYADEITHRSIDVRAPPSTPSPRRSLRARFLPFPLAPASRQRGERTHNSARRAHGRRQTARSGLAPGPRACLLAQPKSAPPVARPRARSRARGVSFRPRRLAFSRTQNQRRAARPARRPSSVARTALTPPARARARAAAAATAAAAARVARRSGGGRRVVRAGRAPAPRARLALGVLGI